MRRIWTKEAIKIAITDLHNSGQKLSYTHVLGVERRLLQAAVRYFGTWEAAVNACGLNYDSYRRHRKPEQPPIEGPVNRRPPMKSLRRGRPA